MTSPLLTTDELAAALTSLTGWEGDTDGIHRTVAAPDFPAALAIVQEVGFAAEKQNHHPDIDIRWRHVTFTLSTHDAGGKVTDRDVTLARRIDEIAGKHGA